VMLPLAMARVMLRTSWLRLLIYINLFVVVYHVAFPLR
jgi:hypothetical protein